MIIIQGIILNRIKSNKLSKDLIYLLTFKNMETEY